jgi:acyl dehydratase
MIRMQPPRAAAALRRAGYDARGRAKAPVKAKRIATRTEGSHMLTLNGLDEVKAYEGKELGVSDWLEVTQEKIDRFAEVTGDDQWIHIDVERARQSPFGGTIAHGYFTLSLAPRFSYDMFDFEGFAFGINYGVNRVRFPAPLPVGSKVRMRAVLASVQEIPGGAQITTELTFEREGGEKPVCVAESLSRVYTG